MPLRSYRLFLINRPPNSVYAATHAQRLSRNEANVINGNNLEKVAIVNELEVRGIDEREREREKERKKKEKKKPNGNTLDQ